MIGRSHGKLGHALRTEATQSAGAATNRSALSSDEMRSVEIRSHEAGDSLVQLSLANAAVWILHGVVVLFLPRDALYSAKRGLAIACRLYVPLSVCDVGGS